MTTPLRARVRHGRLVLAEPTDLPEGTEVELEIAGSAEEDAELLAILSRSIQEHEPGTGVPAEALLEELGSRR